MTKALPSRAGISHPGVIICETPAPADQGSAGFPGADRLSPGIKSRDAYPDAAATADCIRLKEGGEVQWLRFCSEPLRTCVEPGPYTLPAEMLGYEPSQDTIFKYFFKGTSKEVKIRQIFFHTPLTAQEEGWLSEFRAYCRWKNFPLHQCVEPLLLRICYYNQRKYGDKYIVKSYDHLKEALNWRGAYMPFSDSADPDILDDLRNGVVYWAARDTHYRPLLIVRLKRLPKNASPDRFKKLVVFCFEWAIRYIFVPGKVETCVCLFDVRGIAVHSFPMSAISDMTTTLTRQYPFRLDRMIILNDSLFIQTVWQIAKQFLTEVQQQKMCFMRSGFEKELRAIYAPHHLEREFGGSRQPMQSYYPFPLLPGPFDPRSASAAAPASAVSNCHLAVDRGTVAGAEYWEGSHRPPIKWAQGAAAVFERCGLRLPEGVAPAAAEPRPGDESAARRPGGESAASPAPAAAVESTVPAVKRPLPEAPSPVSPAAPPPPIAPAASAPSSPVGGPGSAESLLSETPPPLPPPAAVPAGSGLLDDGGGEREKAAAVAKLVDAAREARAPLPTAEEARAAEEAAAAAAAAAAEAAAAVKAAGQAASAAAAAVSSAPRAADEDEGYVRYLRSLKLSHELARAEEAAAAGGQVTPPPAAPAETASPAAAATPASHGGPQGSLPGAGPGTGSLASPMSLETPTPAEKGSPGSRRRIFFCCGGGGSDKAVRAATPAAAE